MHISECDGWHLLRLHLQLAWFIESSKGSVLFDNLGNYAKTRRPVLPGTPSLVSVEHMEIVPAAPVVPGEHVKEMFRLLETCSDINYTHT